MGDAAVQNDAPRADDRPTHPSSPASTRGALSTWVPIGAIAAVLAMAGFTSFGPRVAELFGR
jgi:hypothetical protein